jgi:hypothetical protein
MSRDPKPEPDPKPDPNTPLGLKPTCPNCGHGPAVIFPVLNDGHPAERPKLVCLLCCPKRSDHS